MKIGIVSDSHGRCELLTAALGLFAQRGVDAIVHCGDVGSIASMRSLGAVDTAAYAVAGNMDRHIDQLAVVADECGVNFHWEVIEMPIGDGRYLVATHGHDHGILNELIAGRQFPYVCHGHTHRVQDERFGQVRVICPGALRTPRNPRHPTVAILDTDSDSLEFIAVQNR